MPPTDGPGTCVKMLVPCCQMSPNTFTSGTPALLCMIIVGSAGIKSFLRLLYGRGRSAVAAWEATEAWPRLGDSRN